MIHVTTAIQNGLKSIRFIRPPLQLDTSIYDRFNPMDPRIGTVRRIVFADIWSWGWKPVEK